MGLLGVMCSKNLEKKIEEYKPEKLIIFSRDEFKQFEMSQRWGIKKRPCVIYFLGDVLDKKFYISSYLKRVLSTKKNLSVLIKTGITVIVSVLSHEVIHQLRYPMCGLTCSYSKRF